MMFRHIVSVMRSNHFLVRIVSSYVAVGLLVAIVLTFIITAKVSWNLKDEVSRSADRAVEQSYNTANILLNSAFDNYAAAFGSADIQYAFYNEDFDSTALGKIGNKLYELSSTNPLVHSIYLFNYERKLVFSSLSTVRTFDDFYDSGMLRLLRSYDPTKSGVFISRHIRYDINVKPYDNDLISIVYLNSIGRNANGAMVVNLDQRMLQSMVMDGTGRSSFQTMILNKMGTVISHTNIAMVNTNLADQSYVRAIGESNEPRGTLEMTKNGKKYRISYIKSDSLGWTFVAVIDYDSLLGNMVQMKRYILSVTAVLVLIVLGLGGFFTRLIYGPVRRLIRNVQDLQTSVADYRSAKRNEVLRLLLAGGWKDDAEITRKLKLVGVEFEHPRFLVCLLRLDSFRSLQDTYKQSDIGLLKYAVSNIAVELSSRTFRTVSFDCGEDAVALVANVPASMEHAEQASAAALRDIQTNVGQYLKLSVSAAMGTLVQGLAQIKNSWSSASDAARYILVLGPGCVAGQEVPGTRESLQESRVAVLEKQVTDSMKLGDAEKTRTAVGEFIGLVRHATVDEMMLTLTQLLIAIVRSAKAMGAAEEEESRLDIGILSQQLYRMETMEEIESWYFSLCESAICRREQQSLQKNRWVVDKVLRHIHDHYSDPSLTVDTLVEIGGLSTNYLRKIFKDIVGQSLTVYLTEYRFEKAKGLLLGTDLPANRIGELVGFENTNYFYIAFKKHFGKTPNHFRRHSKFGALDEGTSSV
jgi:AraC-like DNA-binding protein